MIEEEALFTSKCTIIIGEEENSQIYILATDKNLHTLNFAIQQGHQWFVTTRPRQSKNVKVLNNFREIPKKENMEYSYIRAVLLGGHRLVMK